LALVSAYQAGPQARNPINVSLGSCGPALLVVAMVPRNVATPAQIWPLCILLVLCHWSHVCKGHFLSRSPLSRRHDAPCWSKTVEGKIMHANPVKEPFYVGCGCGGGAAESGCADESSSGSTGASVGGSPVPKPKPQRNLSASLFYLEHVGLAASGVLGTQAATEAMQSSKPALCLTSSQKEDTVGGFGLSLRLCEASVNTMRGVQNLNNVDPELKKAQQFKLMRNGEIRTVGGKCIRRVRCAMGGGRDHSFIYDVGRCNGPGYVAKFVLEKPELNRMERMHLLGFPESLFRKLRCSTCGPYMLVEQCLSRGELYPDASRTCGKDYHAKPGFTKMPSTYVGDAAVQGRPPRIDAVDTLYERLTPRGDGNVGFGGLAATDWDGICGSYVTDGMTMDSFFVFHRAE